MINYESSVLCEICGTHFTFKHQPDKYPCIICDDCQEVVGPLIDKMYNAFKKTGEVFSFWYRWLHFTQLTTIAYKMWANDMWRIKRERIEKNRRALAR